jgi:GxxExxY protein
LTPRREGAKKGKDLDRFDDEIEALVHAVIGAAIAVHRALGPGFAESVYCNALALELSARNITFEREYAFEVVYRDTVVGSGKIDFFVGRRLVVEVKAASGFSDAHIGQTLAYITQVREPLGLLLNFGAAVLASEMGVKRVVQSKFARK